MEKRKRIVLVTSLLGGGGAERVLVTMARWWSEQGSEVAIVVLRSDPAIRDYEVPPGIEVRRLNLIGERNAWWSPAQITRLMRLRRKLRDSRPDVVISFIDKLNVAVLLALTGTGIPVVATEHLVPWRHPMGWTWETLRRLTYPHAARVVCPTLAIADYLRGRVRARFEVLKFPVDLRAQKSLPMSQRPPLVFSAGRLATEKGYDILIAAFARVRVAAPQWRLEIAGEGPLRAVLTEQIVAAGLTGAVRLLGHQSNARERMGEVSIFVLASRAEAFPMVVCEAMSAGASVIATDCPTGPREMIADGTDGLLVPPDDSSRLAVAIIRLIENRNFRERLAAAALASAEKFGAPAIMPRWSELVGEILERKK